MNINRVRTLIILVNVGLAAGTGYTVYKEFDQKKTRTQNTQRFRDKLEDDLKNAPKARTKDKLRVSIKDGDLVDLTGDRPKPVEVRPAESVASSRITNPLDDQIKIVTIAVHPDRRLSKVTVLRKTGADLGAERVNFSEGDQIPFAGDAVVLEIRPEDVVFQNGDREEILKLPDTPTAAAGGRTDTQSSSGDPGNRPFMTYVESKQGSGIVTIRSGGDRALAREGEAVLEGVVFSSTEGASGKKALRVDTVPPNSVLAQHGVKDGDTLVSVDGIAMSSKSEVVEYAKRNKNKQVFEVVIQRRGVNIKKSVVIQR